MTTMSDGYFQDGAAESSAIFHQYYGLSLRWGKNHPVGLTMRFVSPPSPKPPPGPFAEVRAILVAEVRYSDKPEPLKNAAEVWVAAIDEVHECGLAPHNEEALKEAHARFLRAAKGNPPVQHLPFTEIAKTFRLGAAA